MAKTTVPSWQVSDLYQLAQSGQLSGVDPSILVGIDQAESSGNPGPRNSDNVGGYFGQPTGNLGVNSATEFGTEAQAAAGDYAVQQQTFGDNYLAEAAYQVGPSAVDAGNMTYQPPGQPWQPISSDEGVGVFQSLGIPESPGGTYPTLSSSNSQTSSSGTSGGSGGSKKALNLTKLNILPEAPGGDLDPLNWLTGASEVNGTFQVLFPFIIMGVGILLVIAGMFLTFRGQTKVNIQLPQTNSGQQQNSQPPKQTSQPPKKGPGIPAGRGAAGDAAAAGDDAALAAA